MCVLCLDLQGTNAHAILEQSTSGHHHAQINLTEHIFHWQRKRHWIVNPAHAIVTSALMSKQPGTAILVADLCSARAAAYVHGMTLHNTAVASLDLYLEVMAGAVQQLNPKAASMQLVNVAAAGMLPLDEQSLHPVVIVHGHDISISTRPDSVHNISCQGVVCDNSRSSSMQISTASTALLTALEQMLLATVTAATMPAQQPAATAATTKPWDHSQGFCLLIPNTTATAQLHSATTLPRTSAVIPTAVKIVAATCNDGTDAEHIATAAVAQPTALLSAAVLHDGSSASVAQLRGIQLSSASSFMGTQQTKASNTHMLYQTQWAVTAPSTSVTPQQLLPRKSIQPVALCALLMAVAQQAAQRHQAELNLHVSAAEPDQAMAVAMLRSVAQETTAVSCTATVAPATPSDSAVKFASSSNTTMPAISKLDSGSIYQPSLLPVCEEKREAGWGGYTRTCIILGGTGSVGSLAGSWVMSQGVREIVLVGRTGKLSEASAANIANVLARQATEVEVSMLTIARCDAAGAEESSWLYSQTSPVNR